MTGVLSALNREVEETYGALVPRRGRGRPAYSQQGVSPENQERMGHILALRRAGHTLEDIGAAHGITRERVRQLLKREGASTLRCAPRTFDPLALLAFARSSTCLAFSDIDRHFGKCQGEGTKELRRLGVYGALKRLYRLRYRARLLQQVHEFIEREGRMPFGSEMGTRAGTPRRIDLPGMNGCIKAFGSAATFWRALGVSPRATGGRGHVHPHGLRGPRVTHCCHGHEYTPENTYAGKAGRQCKTCIRARSKARYARHKLALDTAETKHSLGV